MTRVRTWRATMVAAVAIAATAVGMSPASAASLTSIKTFEHSKFVPGPRGGLVLNWGFDPATVTVHSGSMVRWTHTGHGEPHTASVVRAADVPKTADEILACFLPRSICGKILARHDPGNDQQPPFHTVVNSGAPGVNQAGDSVFLLPQKSVTVRVTAPSGTVLHYICAFHAWMQAKIRVS
jgi:plastocyanin